MTFALGIDGAIPVDSYRRGCPPQQALPRRTAARDDGRVVFISEGMQLRIPEGALQIRVDEDGSLSSPPVHFEVRLDVWPYWLDVGLEHALAALHARGELEGRASEQTGQWTAELLEKECRAGMVAIASAAFALDALYASLVEAVSGFDELQAQWREKQTPRHARVFEALQRSFKMGNTGARQASEVVQTIYRFRDWAVHPPGDYRAPLHHDVLDVGVEWRFVAFSGVNASRAVRSAASLIRQCVDLPRESRPALSQWCDAVRPKIATRWDRIEEVLPG